MKKLIDIVSNRIFLTAVAVLLQLVWIFAVLWGVGAFSGHLMNLISILSLILVLWIVNKKINPSYKLAWTILILAVPVFGVIIYLLFGQSRVARKMTQDSQMVLQKIANYFKEDKKTREDLENTDLGASIQSAYIRDFAGFPVHENTSTKYYAVGDDMFIDMLEDLKKAEHYIFLEYFIIREGRMWGEILAVLEEKVKQGVDVRLIYDDMGCVNTLPHKYYKKLQAKDLINLGLFTVLYFVLGCCVAIPIGFVPVFLPILGALWSLITGIPFMLFLTRVKKFGMVTLMGILSGLLMGLTGMGFWGVPMGVIFGLLGDMILKSGGYKSAKMSLFGYAVFSLWMTGTYIPMYFTAEASWKSFADSFGEEYADRVMAVMPMWSFLLVVAGIFLFAILGGMLGRRLLRKHFVKAGIV